MAESNNIRLKNTDLDDPNQESEEIKELIQFPQGLIYPSTEDAGPYIEISCFKYSRSFVNNREESLYKVFLPFPFQGMTFGVSANYDPFNAFLGRSEAFTTNAIQGAASLAGRAIGDSASNALSGAISSIPGINVDADAIKNQASTSFGMIFNPRQELSFNGTLLRSYQLSYLLLPRNETESISIQRMIDRMELSSYPDYQDSTKVLLNYPDEFLLSFYNPDGSRIRGCPLVPDCFMSSFSYTINPMTAGRVFNNGYPTSYMLNINLMESNYLARPDVAALKRNILPTD